MDVTVSISLPHPRLSRSSFLGGHNILGKLRGGHQGKSAKHMVLRGGERLGGNTPSGSSPTAEDNHAQSTVSFQDGIFLSKGLLTDRHSAHCYLERQRITHGQRHPSELNYFPHPRQESLEGFSRNHPATLPCHRNSTFSKLQGAWGGQTKLLRNPTEDAVYNPSPPSTSWAPWGP